MSSDQHLTAPVQQSPVPAEQAQAPIQQPSARAEKKPAFAQQPPVPAQVPSQVALNNTISSATFNPTNRIFYGIPRT